MNLTMIEPNYFARIMAMPRTDRHDILEFLGATLVNPPQSVSPMKRFARPRNVEGEPQGK